MTTYRTTITGALDRLEVDPGIGVELDDVVYGIVKLKVSSETDKMTADGETRTVALAVQDLNVVLEESPLLTALKRSIVHAAADRDRAAGRPPLEVDGEGVDGDVKAELDEATERALEELEELERELTGDGDGPDDELEVDPDGADEVAPDDEVGPFDDRFVSYLVERDGERDRVLIERADLTPSVLKAAVRVHGVTADGSEVLVKSSDAGVEPDEDLELEDDDLEEVAAKVDAAAEASAGDVERERYLAVDGRTITEAELEAARAHVIAAFGTDYVDEPSTAIREDLLGLEHVAAWLLRDLRTVEQAAGARPEVLEYLDGRLATTLERYATEDPWKGYRSSTVGTIAGTLERRRPEEEERGNWPELAEHVRAFELAGKNRKGVLDVVDGLLETIPEAELPTPDPDFEPTEDPAGDEADR